MKRRPYRGISDVELLQEFNARAFAETNGLGFLHTGDIPHHIFNGNKFYDAGEILTLWEDEQGIAAWVLCNPRFKANDVQLRPDLWGGEFQRELMDFAEERLLESMRRHDIEGDRIFATAFRGDEPLERYLAEAGWVLVGDPPWCLNRIRLVDLPEPVLPEGYSIRAATGVEEAVALAEVHKGSFGVPWTPELYRKVMESPGYAAEREFVVVAPGGDFAAFTVTWHDPLNRVGLFEPVGTHEDHRRLGLGKALMLGAMRHMVEAGMEWALVTNEGTNEASRALYRAAGFEPWYLLDDYEKPRRP